MIRRFRTTALVAVASLSLLATACGDDDGGSDTAGQDEAATEATELTGVLAIAPGTCEAGALSGSWFRMVQPGGTVADGPFVDNPDTTCADTTATLLSPGTDGGLRLGAFQPQPEPAFLEDGTAAAGAVITPAPFFAVAFGISTNEVDPQTGATLEPPTATADGTALTAELQALSVAWNGQHFNQGAPSPAGEGTQATGTYDPTTGAYSLDWTATVVGGPFNGFTGIWHLEGVLQEA